MDDDPHYTPPAEPVERHAEAPELFSPEERAYLFALLDARVLRQHREARATDRAAAAAAIIEDAIARRYGAGAELDDADWAVCHGLAVQLAGLRDDLEARLGADVVRALLRVLSRGQKGQGRPRGSKNKFYSPADKNDAERQRLGRQRKEDALKALIEGRVSRKLPSNDPVK